MDKEITIDSEFNGQKETSRYDVTNWSSVITGVISAVGGWFGASIQSKTAIAGQKAQTELVINKTKTTRAIIISVIGLVAVIGGTLILTRKQK